MSMKTKFYTAAAIALLLFGYSASAQVLEMTTKLRPGSVPVSGNGFGPRTTNHVITYDIDNANNGTFANYLQAGNPITVTVSLANQQYTGLTYGAGTANATTTGLVFGAGPTLTTGGTVQQVAPLNSYDIMGAFNSSAGPRNGMFMSDPTAAPLPLNDATGGVGIDATSDELGNDDNGGVEVFTTAQVLYDAQAGGLPNNSATRYYFGDVVLTFNRFVTNPVIHIAGMGGSYRYRPIGAGSADTSNYLSTFFTSELEVAPGFSLTRMSGNEFFQVAGNTVFNNCARPNGASIFETPPDNLTFHNYGAATGSFRINGPVRVVTLRVYLRGSNTSQFNWSALQSQIIGGNRNPLTGDIWHISASFLPTQLSTLPATGLILKGALNGNNVTLNWKTLSESNSDRFEIQRSTDGVNFTSIGTKDAAGISTSERNYDFSDPNMNVSVYYYRIKLLDVDTKESFSNIVPIRKSGIKGVRIFPNPVTENLNIEFSEAKGAYDITLFNLAGQEVRKQKADIGNTVQFVPMERGNLTSGTYYLRIKNLTTGDVYNEKLILQ
jgi:hypothetical protein